METKGNWNEKDIELQITCPRCKAISVLVVPLSNYQDYADGRHVQDAFPELNADQRELLITGFCTKCWDEMFPEEEE